MDAGSLVGFGTERNRSELLDCIRLSIHPGLQGGAGTWASCYGGNFEIGAPKLYSCGREDRTRPCSIKHRLVADADADYYFAAVAGAGHASVTGGASSGFPVTSSFGPGVTDVFVTKLEADTVPAYFTRRA